MDQDIRVPKNVTESCPSIYLVPDETEKLCVLPGRISQFKHYALSGIYFICFKVSKHVKIWVLGGKFGAKEPMEQLVSNLQNFQRFLYGEDLERPELLALFNSKQYEAVSRIICGKDHPFYKRVQVNLILMLPGHSRN